MTVCEYGTRPKSTTTAEYRWITEGELCTTLGTVLPQLGALCHLLQPVLIPLDDYCAAPPTPPADIDWLSLATSGSIFTRMTTLGEWLAGWWKVLEWNNYCECTPGPSSPCTFTNFIESTAAFGSRVILKIDNLPSGTGVDISAHTTFVGGGWQYQVRYIKTDGTTTGVLHTSGTFTSSPADASWHVPLYTSVPGFVPRGVQIEFFHNTTSGTFSARVEGTATVLGCTSSAPVTPYVPPATPTPPDLPTLPAAPTGCTTDDLCARIDSLQKTVSGMAELVTLIQRQKVPFATVHGATHAGLTGAGSFAVQGILGLSVDTTATPSRLGTWPGTPTTRFRYGWVNVGTSDGWKHGFEILHDPELISGLDGDITQIGYTFEQGVTATIREIKREP